jgi:hypothetical protein
VGVRGLGDRGVQRHGIERVTVSWIRGPWWDGVWILSGLPIGGALTGLVYLGVAPQMMILGLVLLTQTGHLLSPMALAWSHGGFRRIMQRQPTKYIAFPILIVIVTTFAAFGSSYFAPIRFDPIEIKLTVMGPWWVPLQLIAAVYALWNAYHFGMQAFGVMSIYRYKAGNYDPGQRKLDMIYCCLVTWATILIPFIPHLAKSTHNLTGWPEAPHPFLDYVRTVYVVAAVVVIVFMLWREWRAGRCMPRILFILTDGLGMIMAFWLGLWGFAIVAMNHWLVAIGLASHVHANRRGGSTTIFALGLMAAGMVIFCVLFVKVSTLTVTGFSTDALYFTVTAVGCRLGLGFVHFLYDRWIYKLRDPQVRAAIGRDVLCPAPMSCASSNISR